MGFTSIFIDHISKAGELQRIQQHRPLLFRFLFGLRQAQPPHLFSP